MTADLRIAPMSPADLERALDWAAAEGWNPGLEDAAAFHATDPGGFLMGWMGEVPAACVSITRHSPDFAFLGLYIARPEFRGQGIGLALWNAAITLAAARTIGLDGVPAQQANYARSGFTLTHRTIRFGGALSPSVTPARPVTPAMIPEIIALDSRLSGLHRRAYLTAWLTDGATRHSLALTEGDRIIAVGTIRACRSGHKIGPLFAETLDDAETLLRALAIRASGPVLIDMPDTNPAALSLATKLNLTPQFETARMIRGLPPTRDTSRIFGEVTLELG